MVDNENLFDLSYNALTSILCTRRFLQWNYLTASVIALPKLFKWKDLQEALVLYENNYCIFPSDSKGLDFVSALFKFITLTLNVTAKIEKPCPFSFIENNAFDP